MIAAAFFDLDRTVLTVNSGALWVRRELEHGRIGLRQVASAALALAAYRLGKADMSRALRQALGHYRGEAERDVARWTRDWFEGEVARHVAPGARRALAAHREQGHACVLLTSSSPYLSRLIVERLCMDGWLCQSYEVRDGRLTGEPVVPLCYGAGKVTHAERYAAERGVDLRASYFYSDSYTDLPMLERVGHPGVVNPDVRLRYTARRRGWPILDWSR